MDIERTYLLKHIKILNMFILIIFLYNLLGREAPTIELYPSARQTVLLGGSVLYQCRVTGGIPTPSVKWTRRNGESLPSQIEEIPPGIIKYSKIII